MIDEGPWAQRGKEALVKGKACQGRRPQGRGPSSIEEEGREP
jgi:hypothetical protein